MTSPCLNDAEYSICEHKINVMKARCRECEEYYEYMTRSKIYRRWKNNETEKEKNVSINKKPYSCPVCDGNGKIHVGEPIGHRNGPLQSLECNACKGKGIVWG